MHIFLIVPFVYNSHSAKAWRTVGKGYFTIAQSSCCCAGFACCLLGTEAIGKCAKARFAAARRTWRSFLNFRRRHAKEYLIIGQASKAKSRTGDARYKSSPISSVSRAQLAKAFLSGQITGVKLSRWNSQHGCRGICRPSLWNRSEQRLYRNIFSLPCSE